MFGNPICFTARPGLTVYRGKLLSGMEKGTPVHAGAFIRKRKVVLEAELFSQADRLRLIVVHEIFHFAWVRLSNSTRREFTALIREEINHRARGETGESASIKKSLLPSRMPPSERSPAWRDYVCESFCDSAAAFFSCAVTNEHFTLAERWAKRRREWLLSTGSQGWKC